jgi:3-hydroxymyristoyl/3-hydroxydecanoyl-(acyl carrier protein) dehydratase
MFSPYKWLASTWQRSNRLHSSFLDARQAGLQQLSALIKLQIAAAGGITPAAAPRALFTRADLDELASGSIASVFGPEFQACDTRRTPRIPNTDLLLMSRVMDIQGERGCLNSPASIVTEFDVPEHAWFLNNSTAGVLPAFACMEAALQPCGLLSAYLGTMLLNPQVEYYFRNLDGQVETLAQPRLGGKILTVQADLLSTTLSAGMIIQKFSFTLSSQDQPFYRGESTFGFFPPDTMANQSGLDNGKTSLPELEQTAVPARNIVELNIPAGKAPDSTPQMDFIRTLRWTTSGGKYGKGIIFASKVISPTDWFYRCHFHQDPVMPGSLGVEAVQQALEVYARHSGLLPAGQSFVCIPAECRPFIWKYRGQFAQTNKLLKLEIHISETTASPDGLLVCGDASVWADGLRIYEVKGAAVRLGLAA